jgi:FtsH-binding integral membrane protein
MSYPFYKVLHLVGVIFAFLSLGALVVAARSGHAESRRLAGITHGIALLVILVSGFGILAKLDLGFPAWVLIKIAIWALLGGVIVLIRRQPQSSTLWWWTIPLLGAVAAYLGVYKPL